ncbi:MAG: hypothetical protein ACQEQL_02880 [Pseudomonadota bacterium]
MHRSGKILRSSVAAVFISMAANGGAKAETEDSNPVLESLVAQETDQMKPAGLAFIFNDAAQLLPEGHNLYAQVENWRERLAEEAPLPKAEIKDRYSHYPTLQGDDIGDDFDAVRSFVAHLVEQDTDRHTILKVIAAYAEDFSRYYYKNDNAENDKILRPDIYGPNEDWETLSEVILENGDDCDGLAMLSRQLMIDAGIPKSEIFFLAYLTTAEDAPDHGVIMWNDPDHPHDPIAIDSTGYISNQPYRLSAIDWPAHDIMPFFRFNEDSFSTVSEVRYTGSKHEVVNVKNTTPTR